MPQTACAAAIRNCRQIACAAAIRICDPGDKAAMLRVGHLARPTAGSSCEITTTMPEAKSGDSQAALRDSIVF